MGEIILPLIFYVWEGVGFELGLLKILDFFFIQMTAQRFRFILPNSF